MIRILVAHGTRDPAGQATVRAIAAAVSERVGPVRLAWLDVLEPTLPRVLEAMVAEPVLVVPLLLSEGFHLEVDIPGGLAPLSDRPVTVAPPLGADPRVVDALAGRLREAGWQGERVVLGATGSARAPWHELVRRVATRLGERLGAPVEIGVLSGPGRSVAEALETETGRNDGPAAVAAYLLAEGFFHRRLVACGAPVTSAPIGPHPAMVDLLAERFSGPC